MYFSFIGLVAKPVACGETKIVRSLSAKEACDLLTDLQANTSCIPKLESQFYSVNVEVPFKATIFFSEESFQKIFAYNFA